jgi:hypothetical protein
MLFASPPTSLAQAVQNAAAGAPLALPAKSFAQKRTSRRCRIDNFCRYNGGWQTPRFSPFFLSPRAIAAFF